MKNLRVTPMANNSQSNYASTVTAVPRRKCEKCGVLLSLDTFLPSKSVFAKDGRLPICNNCVRRELEKADFDWAVVDKFCMYVDIPFIPDSFEEMRKQSGKDAFIVYSKLLLSEAYRSLDWHSYFVQFKELEEKGGIEEELPLLKEEKLYQLRQKWGGNYDDEALGYLESLYDGIRASQNLSGVLQIDQAKKLCKLSYKIDQCILNDEDFTKVLGAYDKIMKTAEFTPKNAKNVDDFDSMGEVVAWLEKRGWVNRFYDNVTRDIADETMKNIQASNQRLYINESGIGDDINARIKSLEKAQELENFYGTDQRYDLEEYSDEAWKPDADEEKDEVFDPTAS